MSKLVINPLNRKSKINREIYGQFSEHLGRCIYEGLYVGEDSPIPNVNGMRTDVVEALKAIKIPVLRWPGGCFADEYHWKDGIGPKENRKKMINTHWGGVVEDNSFGTHEFMELCRQLGCKAYINGNLGSGSVQEMSEWVEYLTFDGLSPMTELRKENGREEPWEVAYFGVGNENWGCGGHMTPEHYANEYRRYETYCRNYHQDKQLYKIACGPNEDDYNWTQTVMKICTENVPANEKRLNGLSLHYYTTTNGFGDKGSATEFTPDQYYTVLSRGLKIEELIRRHSDIMNQYDPNKEIGLIVDEWGTWYDVEPGTNPGFLYQQNTMRDALVASTSLDIFHKHSDRVKMANIAQMVNVLQAMILTEGEKMILTPTYHVFKMYSAHQDCTLIDSFLETEEIGTDAAKVPNLHESASIAEDGTINLSVSNLSASEAYEVQSILVETKVSDVSAMILTQETAAHNTFEDPDHVCAKPFTDFKVTEKEIDFTIPACSVVQFAIR